MWAYIFTALAVIVGFIYWKFFSDSGDLDSSYEQMVLKIKPIERTTPIHKPEDKKKKDGIPLPIYFYSQTGTAEDFSKRLSEEMESLGFAPSVTDVEEVDPDSFPDLVEDKLMVFFASTYGEGDPPDASVTFHEWLMSSERDPETFTGVKYAVFGLGNKSYDRYNEMGKQIYKRLGELGATPICDLGLGDDEENIENDFLVWKKYFRPFACQEYGLSDEAQSTEIKFKEKMVVLSEEDVAKLRVDPNMTEKWRGVGNAVVTPREASRRPSLVDIISFKELYSPDAGRSCMHIEFLAPARNFTYEAGHHLGIYPENDPEMVEELGRLLAIDLNQVILMRSLSNNSVLVGPCTVRALLSQYYDIAFHVKKPTIKVLAHFATGEDKVRLEALCSDDPEKQTEFNQYIVHDQRTIVDLLREFPNVKVPAEHLFEYLPKLQCRYYSISSSPSAHQGMVHITAALEEWTTPTGRKALGVATGWMARNKPQKGIVPRVPCYIRPSHFLLPKSLETPMIMVGPGTGLAPFRGFLHERRHLLSLPANKDVPKGECVLFFGCRNPDHDYMYKDELEGFLKDGTLSDLQLAFSRVGKEKVYVQHKMKEGDMPKKLWNILNSGGYFYVCGDAQHMAVDVNNTLAEIISSEGGMSPEEAKRYLEKMTQQSRYHADVW